jgi:hypothetical protein
MKRNSILNMLLAGILITVAFGSCKLEEEDIFSESPAARIENTLKSYNDILCAAPNGWVMEYFPTSSSQGYTFLMKFNKSTAVTIAAKNTYTSNTYKTETSVFELIGDYGPVLTFNSYNKLFHLFSNPEDPLGTSDLDGYGLEGDYEFIVMSADSTTIRLRGKKRSTDIYLRKLDKSVEWESYFNQIDAMKTQLFANNHETLNLQFENQNLYKLKNDIVANGGYATIFRIYKDGLDPITDGEDRSYIITPKGIRFYEGFTDGTKAAQTFELSTDQQQLACVDNGVSASITGQNPAKYYMSNTNTWNYLLSEPMGSTFLNTYNTIVANCSSVLKEKFTNLYLRYNSTRKTYTLSFKSGKYVGYYDFARTDLGDNKVSLQYIGTSDANGTYYLKTITGFQSLLDNMSQTFTITANCGINVSLLKFTAVGDPNISFYVSL